jgi:hypothetical protein
MGVTEIDPNGKATDKMRLLWTSLKRRLGRLKQCDKAAKEAA